MIRTERIFLNSAIRRHEDLQLWAADFAEKAGIGEKNALRLSLLVEETVGMVRGLMDDFESELWLEGDRGGCALHLDVVSAAPASAPKAAGSAPAGFMARIGELLQCAFHFDSDADVPDAWLDAVPGYMGLGAARGADEPLLMGQWSLGNYRQTLQERVRRDAAAGAALEELEKSIVACEADDVIIGIRDRRVSMVITKAF